MALTKRPSNYPLSVQTDEKFYEGRKTYGADWHGERPMIEALLEAVDMHVYLQLEMSPNGLAKPGTPTGDRVCEIANRLGDIVAELREIITVVGDQIDEVFVIPNGEFGRWEE